MTSSVPFSDSRRKRIEDLLGSMPTSQFSYASFEQKHPAVKQRLEQYSRFTLMKALGGLHLLPERQSWSLRLDALMALTLRNCRGKAVVNGAAFDWLVRTAIKKTDLFLLEDPSEDVHVGNIATADGNYLVLLGSWELPDLHAEHLLELIEPKVATSDLEWLTALRSGVYALLRLSDAALRRVGLQRWASAEDAGKNAALPPLDRLVARGAALFFTESDLQKVGVAREELAPFISDIDVLRRPDQCFAESELDDKPMVSVAGGLFLALPAAVCVAIRTRILQTMRDRKQLSVYAEALQTTQRRRIEHEVRAAGGAAVDLRLPDPPPSSIVTFEGGLVTFDDDKVAHVVAAHPNLDIAVERGLAHEIEIDAAAMKPAQQYLDEVQRLCLADGRWRGGMTICIGAGAGGAVPMVLAKEKPNWSSHTMRIGELGFLSGTYERDALLHIYKLSQNKRWLRGVGTSLVNPNGIMSLVGLSEGTNHRLFPEESGFLEEPIHHVTVGTSWNKRVRVAGRAAMDRHAAFMPIIRRHVPVERTRRVSFFGTREPIYGSLELLYNGALAAAVEHSGATWWFVVPPGVEGAALRSFAYETWDALTLWAPALLHALPVQQASCGEIGFVLRFDTSPEAPVIACAAANTPGVIDVRLGQERMQQRLLQAENVAERTLLVSLVEAGTRIMGLSVNAEDTVARVLGGAHRRRMHAFMAHRPADALDSLTHEFARLVPDVERGHWTSRLALELECSAETITGKAAANALLRRAVAHCGEAIRSRLACLERHSVVLRCVLNVERLLRESSMWRRTARAVLALHEDGSTHAQHRDSQRAAASAASRTLVEMALCMAPLTGGREASTTDFDELLALADLMLSNAYLSDAVHDDLIPARVIVDSVGEIRGERTSIDAAIRSYREQSFGAQFKAAAAAYERLFDQPEDPDELDSDLETSFASEFGLTLEKWGAAIGALCSAGVERSTSVLCVTRPEVAEILIAAGLDATESENFLDRFALSPRPDFNVPPDGFAMRDVQPWRSRRRLSLVYRPIAIVGDERVVIGLRALDQSGLNLLESLMIGGLDARFFTSQAMKSYVGTVVDRIGNGFNQEVAERMRTLGWFARADVNMTELGAGKKYGDVDVLAWHHSGRIVVIECKRLQRAVCVADIGEQLNRFRGTSGDLLAKHMNRHRWLNENRKQLARVTGVRVEAMRGQIEHLLVTSAIVPLQFVGTLPTGAPPVVPVDRIEEYCALG